VSVVIVNPDEATAAEHAHELYLAGYSTIAATSFPEIRELLSVYQPKALISTVRLGDYNGVHLAIVTRMKHGPVPTILLGEADHVLEQEAARAGAHYLRLPVSAGELVQAVRERVEQTRPLRRCTRQQPAESIPVLAGGIAGRLVDLSELGIGVALPLGAAGAMVDEVDVSMTVCGMTLNGRRIWHRATDNEIRCGIALVLPTPDDIFRWRMVIDQMGTSRGTLST
jgi:DNA-binding response OmpR family regulator